MGRPRNEPREVLLRCSRRMPNGCLEWQGAKDKDGYGKVTINRRHLRAHRLAYETFRGPIPEGALLDHLVCDNPSCIDWWHTEPSTSSANTMRSPITRAALNAAKTHCDHNHPLSGDNLYVEPSNGYRYCRECRRRWGRDYKRRVRKRQAVA